MLLIRIGLALRWATSAVRCASKAAATGTVIAAGAHTASADAFFGKEDVPEIGKAIEAAACAQNDDPNKLCYAATSSGEVIIYKLPVSDGLEAFKVERRDSCGSAGCATGVFVKISSQWRLIFEARALKCLPTKTNGFCDIASFYREFPPASPPKEMADVYTWNGSAYSKSYTKPAAELSQAAATASSPASPVSRQRVGPSFDCGATAVATQPLPQLICRSDELARADLEYVIAYQALRRSLDDQGRTALAKQANAFVEATLAQCRIAKTGSVSAPPTSEQGMCLKTAYSRQRQAMLARLSGDALAEASLTPEEAMSVQRALQAQSFLPPSATIDGVFGSVTQEAILGWQRKAGQRESGFASKEMHAQLTQATQESSQQQAQSTTSTPAEWQQVRTTRWNVSCEPNVQIGAHVVLAHGYLERFIDDAAARSYAHYVKERSLEHCREAVKTGKVQSINEQCGYSVTVEVPTGRPEEPSTTFQMSVAPKGTALGLFSTCSNGQFPLEFRSWVSATVKKIRDRDAFRAQQIAAEEAARNAEAARRAAKVAKRTQFESTSGLRQWVGADQVVANPFVFKDQVVGLSVRFVRMIAEDRGVFASGGQPALVVSKLPSTLFRGNEEAVIAVTVRGTTEVKLNGVELTVPDLNFVRSGLCTAYGCSDYFD